MLNLIGSPSLMVGGRAILENFDKKILLFKWTGVNTWALPGDRAKVGESAEGCVVRAVFETTGLELRNYEPIGFTSDSESGFLISTNGDYIENYLLILYATEWTPELFDSGRSTRELRFFSIYDLPKMFWNDKRAIDIYMKWKESRQFQLFGNGTNMFAPPPSYGHG